MQSNKHDRLKLPLQHMIVRQCVPQLEQEAGGERATRVFRPRISHKLHLLFLAVRVAATV